MLNMHRAPPFPCELCDRSFHKFLHLKKHLRLEHDGNQLCEHCFQSQGLTTKRAYLEHKVKHEGGRKQRICVVCLKCFLTPSDLRNHCMESHSDLFSTCPICVQPFPNNSLKMHISKMHRIQGNAWHCEHCGESFARRTTLQRHQSKGECRGHQFTEKTLKEWKGALNRELETMDARIHERVSDRVSEPVSQ